MILTKKQQEGLDIAIKRHREGYKYTVISGYAGSGKSTLVRFIVNALDVEENKVCYCAFTGKAAEVLRKKGNKNVCTLHKLLYEHIPRQAGGFIRRKKDHLDYDVIIVDEISMVPKFMVELLFNHKVYVICLGDSFQLPPIDKEEDNHLLDHPHVFLDEIMRQAQESEIIRLTMKIRNQESIDYYNGDEVKIFQKKDLVTGHLLWADTILCATNATRHNINKQMRQILGYEGNLQSGEKLLIKRNYWSDLNEDGDSLVNGTIGIVKNPFDSFIQIPPQIKNDRYKIPTIMADFLPEYGKSFGVINFDKDFLLKEQPCLDWRVSYQLGKMQRKIGDIIPRQATYGYALTTHAAQGSQWSKVLVLEENFPFNREEHARWLYTACTRPEKQLVIIR